MAATGFTPIQLYRTTTASAQPSAGNLADGELAINLTDKKLYAKDASNNVFVLADASSGGTTATNLAGGAAGSVPYQTGASTTTFLGIGTAAQVLQVNSGATAPEWVNTSGTGNVARTTSPSFTTPSLGAATALSINSLTLTTSTGTFTLANGKTLTVNNSLTLSGTDATTMTFPSTSATIARTDAAQTFTGTQTVQAAATQDAVALAGRAGGTSSYVSTLTPTTLSASRTVTLPDADTTVPVATQVLTFTGPTAGRTITLPDANFTVARSDAAQSFTGTQTFLSNPVLDAGTANGVLYLNASKVVTSGSALTFDGSNLETTGNTTLANNKAFQIKNTGGTAQQVLTLGNDNNVYLGQVTSPTAASLFLYGNQQVFAAGGSEQMRLTSTGLGIGTSSPTVKLQVGNGTGTPQQFISGSGYDLYLGTSGGPIFGYASGAISAVFNSTAVPLGIGTASPQPLIFGTGSAEQMRLDSSGNLGIGTTSPAGKLDVNGDARIGNATAGTNRALQINGVVNKASRIAFQESGVDRWLIGNGAASENGNFEIFDATTGNNFVMTRSGNLGLGVVPSAWGTLRGLQNGRASLAGQSSEGAWLTNNAFYNGTNWVYMTSSQATMYQQLSGVQSWFTAPSGTAGNAISFTQAMTLDASGRLGIGETSPTSKVHVSGSDANGLGIRVDNTVNSSQYLTMTMAGGTGFGVTGWDNSGIIEAVADGVGSGTRALYLSAYNGPMLFATNGRIERARITSGGNFVVGTAALATTATDGFLYVPTCAGTPTGTPTTQTGTAPIVVDTTNNKLYFYSGGQWRDAGP